MDSEAVGLITDQEQQENLMRENVKAEDTLNTAPSTGASAAIAVSFLLLVFGAIALVLLCCSRFRARA